MAENEVVSIAKTFADKVRTIMDTNAVYLYRSYAKGTATENSDVDIAVIVDSIPDDYLTTVSKLWRIEGEWFAKATLTISEYCGFFPRQALGYYLCNSDNNSLDTDRMLSVEEYHKLDTEEKKAYRYYEYTDSESERLILYNFKEAVVQRLKAINERVFWSSEIDSELFFSDVRVLLLEG